MPGSLQPRVKTWVSAEDVVYSDLNAEFDNVLLALQPLLIDDYSTNAAQMQVTADPGEVGSESLATTLAGELARLRFIIEEITGENQWYESPIASLTGLSNAIGTGLTDNRIVSGRKRSDVAGTLSAQPVFLVPNGAARTVKLDGTPTTFIYYVGGTEYSVSSDVTLTNLTAAPSSNNTAVVNDSTLSAQYWTKTLGEMGTEITIGTVGSNITNLVGSFAGFKVVHSAATEYFTAYVKSATSLSKAKRGYFFDSTDTPIPRVALSNSDTITLMKLTWVFVKTDGTLTATYNNPTWSDAQPSSPSTGDYWFDTGANAWYRYDVSSFVLANATLVGCCLQDSTNTVAARSFEFFKAYSELNTTEVIAESNSQVKSAFPGAITSVWGSTIKADQNIRTWDMTLDLETGVSEGASTFYYFYLTETGAQVISDIKPFDRRSDLFGWYHPYNSWRCVGYAYNDGSSNLTSINSFYSRSRRISRAVTGNDFISYDDTTVALSGTSSTMLLPTAVGIPGKSFKFIHKGTSFSQIYTLTASGTQTIGTGTLTSFKLHTNGEVLGLESNGTTWDVVERVTATQWGSYTLVAGSDVTATTVAPAFSTVTTVKVGRYRREGPDLVGKFEFKQESTGGAAAGTGDYLFVIPNALTIDTTKVSASSVTTGSTFNVITSVGHGQVISSNSFGVVNVTVFNGTTLRLYGMDVANYVTVGAGSFGLGNSGAGYNFEYRVPITDWQP